MSVRNMDLIQERLSCTPILHERF